MSEKSYHWQDHVPASKHNGGWALIMHCHRLLAGDPDSLTDTAADNIITMRETKIDQHGEPPVEFVRAWLTASADTWKPLLVDQNRALAAYAKARVDATRGVWRRMISTPGGKS